MKHIRILTCLFAIFLTSTSVGFESLCKHVSAQSSPITKQQKSSLKNIRVVALLPLTGPAASYGQHMKIGINLAAIDIPEVTVEFIDSKGQPSEAVKAVNQLIARRGNDALGLVVALSSVSKAVAPIAQDKSIPTVLTCVASPNVVTPGRFIQPLFWTTDDFIPPIASEIDRQHKKLAVLTLSDDYGKACETTINARLKTCVIVLSESFPIGGGDMETLTAKVVAAAPDAVFLGGFGPNFIGLIGKIRTHLPGIAVYTSMDLGNPQVRATLADAAEGVVFPALSPDLNMDSPDNVLSLKRRANEILGTDAYVALTFYAYDALLRLVANLRDSTPLSQPAKQEIVSNLENGGLMLGVIKDRKPIRYQPNIRN